MAATFFLPSGYHRGERRARQWREIEKQVFEEENDIK